MHRCEPKRILNNNNTNNNIVICIIYFVKTMNYIETIN